MLKRLGRFAVLAVCLFAMAIVGCGTDNGGGKGKGTEIIKPTTEPTPMEKLPGLYELVEFEVAGDGGGIIFRPPTIHGVLSLHAYYGPGIDGNNDASIWFLFEGRIVEEKGTWSADKANITIASLRARYTWDGTYLTLPDLPIEDGVKARLKWQRTDDWSDDGDI